MGPGSLLLVLGSALLSVHCQAESSPEPGPERSSEALVNGTPTSQFPAVVQLEMEGLRGRKSRCTGTFINDSTVLTAAHCFGAREGTRVTLLRAGNGPSTLALGYRAHPDFSFFLPGYAGPADIPVDVALVFFPPKTSRDFLKIRSTPMAAPVEVMAVGYGSSSQEWPEGAGTKTHGKALLLSRTQGTYIIKGFLPHRREGMAPALELPTGSLPLRPDHVLVQGGDSGGPLLDPDDGSIVAVASSTGVSTEDPKGVGFSEYVDLSTATQRAFLKNIDP